jgi:hypothetical protein
MNNRAKIALDVRYNIVQRGLTIDRSLGVEPIFNAYVSNSNESRRYTRSMKPCSFGFPGEVVKEPALQQARHVMLAFACHRAQML